MVGEIIAWKESRDRQGIAKIYTWTFFVYSPFDRIL